MRDSVITLRLPDEKVRRLRQIAAREKTTLTAVIERSLDAALAGTDGAPQSNRERLAYAIGQCASGGNDVTQVRLGDILTERHRVTGQL